jgi:RNA-directed DNA polymerase
MSMERRDQQNLNLIESTSPTHSSGQQRQMKLSPEFESWRIRISLKAQRDTKFVFTNLFKHINIESLKEAFTAINGSKAVGVDQITKQDYGRNLEANLEDLLIRIKKGTYRPKPKREILIPKANGKTRPIAISSLEDKLVDWCVGTILQEVYEPLFIRNSFGYRRGKSAHQAIEASYYSLEKGNRPHVVEIDFSNFFNTIPHKKLMKVLNKRIADKRFIGLIYRLLTGEIMSSTNGQTLPSMIGTPQGGIASPTLANIYLNEVVDQWFIENHSSYNNIIVRYADDAVFFFKKEDEAKEFLTQLRQRVKTYGLSMNEEKTRVIKLEKKSTESFNFLGFTFYRGKQGSRRTLKIKTQKEKLNKAIVDFYQWIKTNRNKYKLEKLWDIAKAKITGHLNYYCYWMNNTKIFHFYAEATQSLFKWLNRRSQKRSYNLAGFKERVKNFPLMPEMKNIKWKSLGRSFGNI